MTAVQRVAAFSRGRTGGNPAGVVVADALPPEDAMRALAAELTYSETVFAARQGDGYRVRYFAPTAEVPFCGHATVALGAALARAGREGPVELVLNNGAATVAGRVLDDGYEASLLSPPCGHAAADPALSDGALALFGLGAGDLADAPLLAWAGARHLFLPLRACGDGLGYDLARGAALMRAHGLATVALAVEEAPLRWRVRHAFAGGGVAWDPATGAGAAALAGWLGATGRATPGAEVELLQGAELGVPCRLLARVPDAPSGRVRVTGEARFLDH